MSATVPVTRLEPGISTQSKFDDLLIPAPWLRCNSEGAQTTRSPFPNNPFPNPIWGRIFISAPSTTIVPPQTGDGGEYVRYWTIIWLS